MDLKSDINEAKDRMNAWWEHEIFDRPVISYYHPKGRGANRGYLDAVSQDWTLLKTNDINQALEGFEKRAKKTYFGGEAIPTFRPNYGPGILAAVFGVTPKFESETVWFNRPTKPNEIIALLESVKLNQNNEWYSRIIKITQEGSERAGKMGYQFSITDLGGVLDILSSFLNPTNMILTMKRNPEIIDTCRSIILEKLLKIYDELYTIIKSNCHGCNAWLNVWCNTSWYPVQCDFLTMLNPKWVKRFVLPDLITQIEHMDYAIYHMDGPNQLPFLDDFLSISELTGIQWVPGAGKQPQGSEEWIPIYKKIQKAGKNVVIDSIPENVSHLYKVLDPKGLFVRVGFSSGIASKLYLPTFIDGENGKLIDKSVNWAKGNELSRVGRKDILNFIQNEKIELSPKVIRELVKETNSCLREKLFFT